MNVFIFITFFFKRREKSIAKQLFINRVFTDQKAVHPLRITHEERKGATEGKRRELLKSIEHVMR